MAARFYAISRAEMHEFLTSLGLPSRRQGNGEGMIRQRDTSGAVGIGSQGLGVDFSDGNVLGPAGKTAPAEPRSPLPWRKCRGGCGFRPVGRWMGSTGHRWVLSVSG